MLSRQYKELWEIRFKKILDSEMEAIVFYRRLLKEYRLLLSGTKAVGLLKQVLRDEAKHARIARELLRFVNAKMTPENKEKDREERDLKERVS